MIGAIVAHLRAAAGPVCSRDLAERFLFIRSADEETCRRLLAPILAGAAGVGHEPGKGWRCEPKSAGAARAAGDGHPVPSTPAPIPTPAAGVPGDRAGAADSDDPFADSDLFEDAGSPEDGGSLLEIVALALHDHTGR